MLGRGRWCVPVLDAQRSDREPRDAQIADVQGADRGTTDP